MRCTRHFLAASLSVALLGFAGVAASAAERVALIIGNAAYEHTVPLRNPKNDAADVAQALGALGFHVIEGLDLDEAAFEGKIREFARAAAGAEAALFFYAGHGLQVDGENYLVPVDAELAEEVDLRWDAIPLEKVTVEMRSAVNLVFLDACRDNPLALNLARSMGASRSTAVGRGLGRVESVSGTLIAYATQPGNVADDGEGRNSPFTEALLANLAASGLSVNDLMTSVTDAVATRTNGRQQPWTHSSLRKPFYFNSPGSAERADGLADGVSAEGETGDAAVTSIAAAPVESLTVPVAEVTAAKAYEAAERLHSVEGYEAVERRFSESIFAELARAQIQKLRGGGPAPAASAAAGQSVPAKVPSVVPPPGPEAIEGALELSRSERRVIQEGLGFLGYEPGPADGWFGGGTRGAIERLQSSRGLSATGYLDMELSRELLAAGAEAVAAASAADDAAFARARSSGTSEAYASYLGAYPRGRHASDARRLRAEAERLALEWPAGKEFRDCPVCPVMVVVPAGSFRMGSPPGEEGRNGTEGPVHDVEISRPFAVGKYEVTFSEWDACVSGGGCAHRPGDAGWGRGTRPAIYVSWEDARSYVSWLSGKTGERYRLLSESEWEYAARAGTTGPFHFGSTISTDQANYRGTFTYGSGRKGVYREETVPVGSFSANGFGLHDMHGNVWEWVEDCSHDSYSGAPTDGSAWTTGGDCSRRVLRGGSWNYLPWNLRSANRNWYTTGFRATATSASGLPERLHLESLLPLPGGPGGLPPGESLRGSWR